MFQSLWSLHFQYIPFNCLYSVPGFLCPAMFESFDCVEPPMTVSGLGNANVISFILSTANRPKKLTNSRKSVFHFTSLGHHWLPPVINNLTKYQGKHAIIRPFLACHTNRQRDIAMKWRPYFWAQQRASKQSVGSPQSTKMISNEIAKRLP